MNQIVLVRYGEIALKSKPVRKRFEKTLIKNIRKTLDNNAEITSERGRIYIKTPTPEKTAEKAADLPGIVSTSPACQTKPKLEKISNLALKICEKTFSKNTTFAVRPRRTGNHNFESQDIGEKVGHDILKKFPNMEVDLDSPRYEIHIEARENQAFVFTKILDGPGGLPIETQGASVSRVSGNISSLVSSFLMMKRGSKPVLYFLNQKNSEKEVKKALDSAEKLLKFHPELELVEIPSKNVVEKISEHIPDNMKWIVFERFALGIGELVIEDMDANGLVLDMDLRDLRSYSLENIGLIQRVAESPVFYPLTGLSTDKISELGDEIVESKKDLAGVEGNPFKSPKGESFDIEEIQKVVESVSMKDLIRSAFKEREMYELGG